MTVPPTTSAARANRSIFYDRAGNARTVAGVRDELDQAARRAETDALTGLANRARLMEELEIAIISEELAAGCAGMFTTIMASSLAFSSTLAPAIFADGRRNVPSSKRL